MTDARDQRSRFLALVFTDLADSTALKAQHGDVAGGELIARHREHVTRLAAEGGGRIVDWAGDGCFLTFETASAAVVFALRLQQIHKYEADLPGVRAGIHMGEVSVRPASGGQRVEGLIVDLTARISGLARAGQVLVSGAIQQSAKQRLGIYEFGQPVRWESYGPYTLKGFDEPVEIREAGLENLSEFRAPIASDKAWPAAEATPAKDGAGAAVSDTPIRKLAVLPLANMSGDPGQEYFADGMTEALITELAKIKALRVISRTSVLQYRNTTKPMTTVARELGVDALVEGSVLRAGDGVRISAQLIHGATDEHLWAESYDGTISSILKLQKDVALAIAREINVAVTAEERLRFAQAPRVNPEAYELFLRARRFGGNATAKNLHEGIELLHRAIALAPEFAEAHAVLAFAHWQLAIWGYGDPNENFRKASMASRAAIRLDESNAQANLALGWSATSFEWDWAEADYRFRRALDADSNLTMACFGLAFLNVALGRNAEAFEWNEKQMQLDPRTFVPYHVAAVTRMQARDYPKALEYIQRALDMRGHAVGALADGICIAGLAGRIDLADEWGERAIGISGREPHLLAMLASAHVVAGDRSLAESLVAEVEEQAKSKSVLMVGPAGVRAALGDHERAIAALERCYVAREHYMLWLNTFPMLDPLRGHPRFQALVRKMNFPARVSGS